MAHQFPQEEGNLRREPRVIFATCGSSDFRFDRMMEALEALPAADLTVQHGLSPAPLCASAYSFLPFWTMVGLMEKADVVVSHAGVGSIMCALQLGHVPIVFPRLKRYGETVDDHQPELAAALAARGTVLVATTAEELLHAVQSVPPRKAHAAFPADRLRHAVRAALRGERVRGPESLALDELAATS
jgi:UDP-N-acetylglucosamine transferase subunit ALG13